MCCAVEFHPGGRFDVLRHRPHVFLTADIIVKAELLAFFRH